MGKERGVPGGCPRTGDATVQRISSGGPGGGCRSRSQRRREPHLLPLPPRWTPSPKPRMRRPAARVRRDRGRVGRRGRPRSRFGSTTNLSKASAALPPPLTTPRATSVSLPLSRIACEVAGTVTSGGAPVYPLTKQPAVLEIARSAALRVVSRRSSLKRSRCGHPHPEQPRREGSCVSTISMSAALALAVPNNPSCYYINLLKNTTQRRILLE